jgi:uncharacterized YkwD family protein/spore coat assembly protein SafA
MKKKFTILTICLLFTSIPAFAQNITYTVQAGDSMWQIATKYQAGISDILQQNPSIKNASLIYPGQKLLIPTLTAVKAQENEVVRLVNVERAKVGLAPLTQNWELSRVARYKSQDMINLNYFSHTSPTYGSPFNMMENFGINFSSAGENIAMGQMTPAAVMNAWMNSPGHRANILGVSYAQIGVGLAKSQNGSPYWTQEFIKPL